MGRLPDGGGYPVPVARDFAHILLAAVRIYGRRPAAKTITSATAALREVTSTGRPLNPIGRSARHWKPRAPHEGLAYAGITAAANGPYQSRTARLPPLPDHDPTPISPSPDDSPLTCDPLEPSSHPSEPGQHRYIRHPYYYDEHTYIPTRNASRCTAATGRTCHWGGTTRRDRWEASIAQLLNVFFFSTEKISNKYSN